VTHFLIRNTCSACLCDVWDGDGSLCDYPVTGGELDRQAAWLRQHHHDWDPKKPEDYRREEVQNILRAKGGLRPQASGLDTSKVNNYMSALLELAPSETPVPCSRLICTECAISQGDEVDWCPQCNVKHGLFMAIEQQVKRAVVMKTDASYEVRPHPKRAGRTIAGDWLQRNRSGVAHFVLSANWEGQIGSGKVCTWFRKPEHADVGVDAPMFWSREMWRVNYPQVLICLLPEGRWRPNKNARRCKKCLKDTGGERPEFNPELLSPR